MLSKLGATGFRKLLAFAIVLALFFCLGISVWALRIKVEEGSRFGPKKDDIVNLKGGTVKYKPYLKIDQSLKPLWAVEPQRKCVTSWGSIKRKARCQQIRLKSR